jgi:hypothetical protein
MQPLVAAYKRVGIFKEFEIICNSIAPAVKKARNVGSSGKKLVYQGKKTSGGGSNPGTKTPASRASKDQISDQFSKKREKLRKKNRCYCCKEIGHIT